MNMDLSSGEAQWLCLNCSRTETLKDEETLLMRADTIGSGAGSDDTLFRTFVSLAGNDPTCVKVEAWCPEEKKMRTMSRLFLGAEERVKYACPCGKSYGKIPEKK